MRHRLAARHHPRREVVEQRLDVLHRAALRIRERGVVARRLRRDRPRPHVADDVGDVGVRKEPSHRVDVEAIEVRRVQLLVVRAQELVGDALAELLVEHRAERARLAARDPRILEVEIGQALEELVERQLVDVLLERKVDVAPGVADERELLDRAHLLARHPGAQPCLDLRILEVEEVAAVVPDETVAHDRAAVAAGLGVALEHDDVIAVPPVGEREPGHAGPDHDGRHVRRASSLLKIRRAIAAAQPYVLSIPK